MAKTIIRACDLCKSVDGKNGSIVRNSMVVGTTDKIHRKDLCGACRRKILTTAGYTEPETNAILAEHDKEKVRKPRGTAVAAPAPSADASKPPAGTEESPTAEMNAGTSTDSSGDTADADSASAESAAKANGKAKVPAGKS